MFQYPQSAAGVAALAGAAGAARGGDERDPEGGPDQRGQAIGGGVAATDPGEHPCEKPLVITHVNKNKQTHFISALMP